MRKGYGYGAIGVMVSGMVWLISSFAMYHYSPQKAILTLLIGGVLISPITTLIEKIIGLNGHHKSNPLKHLAMESKK